MKDPYNKTRSVRALQYHTKYQFKSRSDNAPHVYSVADSAYQDVMHNEAPQHILLSGESNSGKTTNMLYIIQHLMYLGKVSDYPNASSYTRPRRDILSQAFRSISEFTGHRSETATSHKIDPRLLQRGYTVESQFNQMRFADPNHVRIVGESLRRNILVVSAGKVARLHPRQVKIAFEFLTCVDLSRITIPRYRISHGPFTRLTPIYVPAD